MQRFMLIVTLALMSSEAQAAGRLAEVTLATDSQTQEP